MTDSEVRPNLRNPGSATISCMSHPQYSTGLGVAQRARVALPIAVCALVVASAAARADGIQIRHTKLGDLVQSGLALEVDVVSDISASNTFQGKLVKVWSRSPTASYRVGDTYTFTLPPPPTLVPGAWIIVHRYWDNMPRDQIVTGRKVVLVTHGSAVGTGLKAYMNASPHVLRKLEVLTTPNGEQGYRQKAANAILELDLADYDIFELAYSTLSSKNRLRNEAIFKASVSSAPHDLIEYHLEKTPEKQRSLFLVALALHLKKTPSTNLKNLLNRRFRQGIKSEDLRALDIYYLHVLDASKRDDVRTMHELNYEIMNYLKSPQGTGKARRFVDHFARFIPLRLNYGGTRESIHEFHDALSEESRIDLSVKLMDSMVPQPCVSK